MNFLALKKMAKLVRSDFALVVYIYAVEVERKNWNLFFAGLAFWGMDWFNEIWNGLVFHFNGYAPVWGAPGKNAYLILIGYLPFFLVSFRVHDLDSVRKKVFTAGTILRVDLAGLLVFGVFLKWI